MSLFNRRIKLFSSEKKEEGKAVSPALLEEVARYLEANFEEPALFEARNALESQAEEEISVGSLPGDYYENLAASLPPKPEPCHQPSLAKAAPQGSSRPLASQGSAKKLPRFQASSRPSRSLEDAISHIDDTFSESLMHLIDQKGLKDSEVYRKANVDRRLFSKIRSNANYQPKKSTALALALALELNLDETRDLIGRAGYALTHASKADIIVEYCIQHECWDIDTINAVLYQFDQELIGY